MEVPILYAHYGYDWIRGSERALLDLLAHLPRERFRPILWCNGAGLAEEASRLDLPVHRSRFSILLDYDPPRFDVANWWRLVREGARLARTHGARLVHASSGAPAQWLLPVARTTRTPLVVQLHAPYALRDRCIMGLTQASLAVGPSRAVLRGLLHDGLPPERTRWIPYGEDFGRLEVGDASGLRRELGIPDGAVVVASVGPMIRRKGFDLLLRAVARLGDHDPEIHLLAVGGGRERAALEALSRELGVARRAHFLGERSDVGPIFRDATDIAASGARSEAFGLTLIEAGHFRLPVVAPAVDGIPEVVDDGDTGLLVPPEDPLALAAALSRLARDPAERRRLGDAGRRKVDARYSIERHVRDFVAAYESLLDAPRARYGWLGGWTLPTAWGRWLVDSLQRSRRS